MYTTDPIADFLTRIRNGIMANHQNVLAPLSKQKLAIAKIFKEEGFIDDFEVVKVKNHPCINVTLRYHRYKKNVISGLKRISSPGRRLYVGHDELPSIKNGFGFAVLSTSQGVITNKKAKELKTGGELLLSVW